MDIDNADAIGTTSIMPVPSYESLKVVEPVDYSIMFMLFGVMLVISLIALAMGGFGVWQKKTDGNYKYLAQPIYLIFIGMLALISVFALTAVKSLSVKENNSQTAEVQEALEQRYQVTFTEDISLPANEEERKTVQLVPNSTYVNYPYYYDRAYSYSYKTPNYDKCYILIENDMYALYCLEELNNQTITPYAVYDQYSLGDLEQMLKGGDVDLSQLGELFNELSPLIDDSIRGETVEPYYGGGADGYNPDQNTPVVPEEQSITENYLDDFLNDRTADTSPNIFDSEESTIGREDTVTNQ